MENVNLKKVLRQMEIDYIKAALTASGGHRGEAARLLSMNRTTLVMRMITLGLMEKYPPMFPNKVQTPKPKEQADKVHKAE